MLHNLYDLSFPTRDQMHSLMLCDNLEEWGGVGGGSKAQEGGNICISMVIHVDVWQKPTQHCKAALTLQLKEKQKTHTLSSESVES